MNDADPSARRPRLRVARGPKRPVYLGDPDLDRVMMMLTALTGEVSAMRDRIDTHEELAAARLPAGSDEVDAFRVSPLVAERRSEDRQAMLNRVFRVLFEELELARRQETAGDVR